MLSNRDQSSPDDATRVETVCVEYDVPAVKSADCGTCAWYPVDSSGEVTDTFEVCERAPECAACFEDISHQPTELSYE